MKKFMKWIKRNKIIEEVNNSEDKIFNIKTLPIDPTKYNFDEFKKVERPFKDHYTPVGLFSIEDIVKLIESNSKNYSHAFVNENRVKINSPRIKNMVCNIDNFKDDITPLYFSLETATKSSNATVHFNLYGNDVDNNVILITQAEIVK